MSHVMSFFFNPIHLIVGTFLFVVSIPLAIFAFWTTWFAFSILFARLAYVYVQMAWEIARYVLWERWAPGQYIESPSVSRRSSRPVTPSGRSPARSPASSSSRGTSSIRRRADSTSSAGPRVTFLGAALLESSQNALERDFEGLGGWRIQDSGNPGDEHAWDSLNSRLELPDHHQQRHHYRSHTHAGSFANNSSFGAPARPSTRSGLHSPGSRTSTRSKVEPFTNAERHDSYFPLVTSQPGRIAA